MTRSSTRAAGQQIFVQLGRLPGFAPQYVRQAQSANPSLHTVLITDRRESLPGVEVVNVADVVTTQEFERLAADLSSSPFDPRWRGGYWRRVFGRFLVLRNYSRLQSAPGPFVHLECDVSSTVTGPLLTDTLARLTAPTGLPFIDPETGCPGIVIARTAGDLAALSDHVIRGVTEGTGLSDMQSLATAAASGLTEALPTRTGAHTAVLSVRRVDGAGEVETADVVFDAAAVGQYLFGVDPRNNRGVLIPGYREVRGDLDPGLWTDWGLCTAEDGSTRVAFREDGRLGVLANLHVHAKIALPPWADPRWATWLSVANHRTGARPTVIKRELARYEVQEAIRRTRRGLRRLQRRLLG